MEKVAREVKKAEAIHWMNILGVNKDIVKLFEDHDIVMACSGTTGTYLPLQDEWEFASQELKDGYVLSWTINQDHPFCSDMGSIVVKRTESGGLIRLG